MIVKSMARKSASFGQLLAYINKATEKGPAILHNLVNVDDDPYAIYREFLDNYRYLRHRKNGNVLYHEVMSFNEADRNGLSHPVIEDLVRRYVEERAPNCLVYAKAHWDRPNPHVHLMLSANEVASARRVRLTTARFAAIKRGLETYQRERYPSLCHSIAQGEKTRKGFGTRPKARAESELTRRVAQGSPKPPLRKDAVRMMCEEQLRDARSVESLLLRLALLGLEVYCRGRHAGVVDLSSGRRYRFGTLGVAALLEDRLAEWAAVEARERLVRGAEVGRLRRRWLEMGYRGALVDALNEQEAPTQGSRRDRLERVRKARARRGIEGKGL